MKKRLKQTLITEMASSPFSSSRLCKMQQIIVVAVLLPISGAAQSYTNVTLGASLLANASNSSWLSPSGEFAFGFRQLAVGGGYLLSIWFDQIPEKTIVWSANRNNLAPEGSTIRLGLDGRLELNDPTGNEIWASSSLEGAYAAMLDTGNLVIGSATSSILWQSFDHPSDTLLPSQVLNQGGKLISSFSQTNYSRGRFCFSMQSDGNFVGYTINFPAVGYTINFAADNAVYYETMTTSGFSFVFNESGYFNLIAQNGTILTHLFDNIGASTTEYHQRLTLEYDGVLRHYLYPKLANNASDMGWSVKAFKPENICTKIRQDTGGGACGLNSLCSIQTDQRPRCDCPNGYSLLDPGDSMGGCKPEFVRQSCDQESNGDHLFGFNDMLNTDWPLNDYAHFRQVNEDWCRRDCLTDCLCDVAIFRNNECWKKRVPLSNGRIDAGVQGKALVKKRNTTAVTPSGPESIKTRTRSGLILAGSVLLGSSVFVNMLFLSSILLIVRFNRRKSISSRVDVNKSSYPVVSVRCFSFKELQEATNDFGDEIGNGAFSRVYKGTLQDENGRVVAVKKLDRIAAEADQQFKAEVSSIGRTSHKHLVQLLGYCDEGQHRILVYEFMSNGSSVDFLFNNSSKPSWHTRIQIAFAVARGLCYLHEDCTTQIIHCDIKHQNVLLDDSHTAKISDFGLAKLLKADQTRTTTGIRGTRGYVAPEWFRNMPITAKVDVYSYGIMLLELLCCRKNFDPDIEDSRMQILADWAYDCFSGARLDLLVSNDDGEMANDLSRFEKLVKVALWCVQEDPEMRPQMKRVVQMLEGSAEVIPPPNPSSFMQ